MKQLILLMAGSVLFTSCGMKQVVSFSGGKSWYVGEESWKDPLGMQVMVETRVVEMNKQSSLNAGAGYSMQGSAYAETGFSGKVSANYIVVPLTYCYESGSGFFAEAGIQPAVLLSAKDKVNGLGTYDYKDAMKSFNMGLPVGLGYRLKNGFGFGARFIPGILKNHKEGNSRDMLLLFRFSYMFSSKK